MKKNIFRRGISGLLAVLMTFTALMGIGTTTAFAASTAGETAESYSVGFPRDGDANLDYSGTWGHDELHYMNGWTSGEATWMTTLHTIGSFDGQACYCIEPGVPRLLGKTYSRHGEDYWKNYPSDCNSTIDADTIKTLLGRIMQYGYQGNLSTSWRSQNDADAEKLAHMMATQALVWETVVGERDANFNHVDPGSADAVKSVYRTSHPLYSRFSAYYDSIEDSVQKHTIVPSFMARSTGKAQTVELNWDGSFYSATLTDTNGVLGNYRFSSNQTGVSFSVQGNVLTISTQNAPTGTLRVTAEKEALRKGVVVWSDGHYGPDGTMQDVVTYSATVSDPVTAFLNLKVSYGGAKIIKTSEDGKVDGITFTITGEGVNQTVTTDRNGEIRIDNLMPGVYTVTEQSYDKYVPQESHRVTVLAGQTATVSFNNVLRRGNLTVTKTSEDGLNQGVKFHLFGTSLSGLPVDGYAVTDENGVATFKDVLIGTGYTLEEMDTAIRYVITNSQSAAVEWNSVTNKSFSNILKKFNVTVTKSDCEVGTAQGDASLAGAAYGIYKGDQLVDTYYTDENGQFTTGYYVCGDDWTIREISPSEGYLLDSTVYPVGAEAANYTVELNAAPAVAVTEQVQKGNIAIIKHSDNGDTQIETPEEGAVFAVYLKAAGSYEAAKDTERDYLTCDENGFVQSKDLPYGVYTVHQVSGWEGRELMSDFDVFIAKDGETYRYLINNANFESFIKVIKVDAETGNTIPYAGAGFQIFRPDGSKVEMTFTYPEVTTIDTFYTNDAGMLITPEKLEFGKGYSLKEVSAPYGYVLSHEAVKFDVAEENSTEESGVTVVAVKLGNYAQKGIIKISKTGEVFASVAAADGVYQPVYTVQGLAGATYEIKATEDIYTPDGTLRCSAGKALAGATIGLFLTDGTEPILTTVSAEDGSFSFTGIPYGEYVVREIAAPEGYVMDDTPYTVKVDQNGAVIEIEITNKLIRGSVQLTKVDKDYPDHHLNGAVFEVYRDGKLVGQMEELSDGVYKLDDLPYGDYTLKETEAPKGFFLDEKTYSFSIKEDGKTVVVENEAGKGFVNQAQTGGIRIEKTSDDGVLKGFTFRVEGSDITGNAFSKDFVTDEKGQIHIEGLRIGDYVISEVSNKANEKYELPANVTVTVHEGKTVVAKFHNKLKPVTDIPKTGDTTNMPLWAALAGISAIGAGAAAFFTFRKKKEVGKHEC